MNSKLEENSFQLALLAMQSNLEKLSSRLRENAPARHAYRFVSYHELEKHYQAIGSWEKSEKAHPWPKIDIQGSRASIFGFGSAGQDLRAYRAVCAIAVVQLIETALPKVRKNELAVAFVMLRGLIERIASANALVEKIAPLLGKKYASREEGFKNAIDTSEAIRIALHGTKLDWNLLARIQFEKINRKSAEYKPHEYHMDVTAKSILNAIDSLEKKIAGSRICYEVLCEFLHPNVGDMLVATTKIRPFYDKFGTRHIETILAIGSTDLTARPEIERVLAEALRITSNIIKEFQHIDLELLRLSDEVARRTRKVMRPILRNNKDLFEKDDLCPCHSGKTVRACCLSPPR